MKKQALMGDKCKMHQLNIVKNTRLTDITYLVKHSNTDISAKKKTTP